MHLSMHSCMHRKTETHAFCEYFKFTKNVRWLPMVAASKSIFIQNVWNHVLDKIVPMYKPV